MRAARGDLEGAAAGLEALLVRANASGGGAAVPECISALADIALATGDAAAACALAEPLIEATLETGPPHFTALGLRALGAAQRIAGELDDAQAALERAATLVAPLGNEWLLARIEYELALVAHARGESTAAEDLLHTALDRQVRHDLKPGIAATLDALGRLASRRREHKRGGALLRRGRRATSCDRTRNPPLRRGGTCASRRPGARSPRRTTPSTSTGRKRRT